MAHIVQVADSKKTAISKSYANRFRDKIMSTMPGIHITEIHAINDNKFLHAAYQLRKAQFQLSHGYQCPTEDLYHATARVNVPSILKGNLDWRRVKRSRFGVGVSFSHCPSYANKFCNVGNGTRRAFIICEVMTGNELRVNQNYSPYPRSNIDTYRSKSGMVVVKFEDDTFYPKCVIYYDTMPLNPYRPLSTYVGFRNDDEDSYFDLDDIMTQMEDYFSRLSLRFF